jgi:hypothetical protein
MALDHIQMIYNHLLLHHHLYLLHLLLHQQRLNNQLPLFVLAILHI